MGRHFKRVMFQNFRTEMRTALLALLCREPQERVDASHQCAGIACGHDERCIDRRKDFMHCPPAEGKRGSAAGERFDKR